MQVFIQGGDSGSLDRDEQGDPMENHALEKRIYILRKSMTHKMAEMESQRFYVCSLSTKTIVYKVHTYTTQCPRTDLGKRFLPKPMTTTG